MKRTTRGQLREGDRPWGGRLWESHQPMNKNLIRGRRDGTSWHNTAKFPHSVPEVNEAVGWRRFQFLSGEICPAGRPAFGRGALVAEMRRVTGQKSAAVVVATSEPGAERCPCKQRNRKPRWSEGPNRLDEPTRKTSTATTPTGRARHGGLSGREREFVWVRPLVSSGGTDN